MIFADLRGKASIAEDCFTSNVLGLLSLLPASDLLDFFTIAQTRDKRRTGVPIGPSSKVKIDFWPFLARPRVCIPDAIVTVEDSAAAPFRLIVESKIGAGQTGDQLADYWRAGHILYRDRFALLYLTDHRSMPKVELAESERRAGPNAKIYWLNWYALFLWVRGQLLSASTRPFSEQQILRMLDIYLAEKGYRTFLEWEILTTGIIGSPYRRRYLHSQLVGMAFDGYVHDYFAFRLDVVSNAPYVSQLTA
jgi:hypothetical protein